MAKCAGYNEWRKQYQTDTEAAHAAYDEIMRLNAEYSQLAADHMTLMHAKEYAVREGKSKKCRGI
jgi:hypothetical protein